MQRVLQTQALERQLESTFAYRRLKDDPNLSHFTDPYSKVFSKEQLETHLVASTLAGPGALDAPFHAFQPKDTTKGEAHLLIYLGHKVCSHPYVLTLP